MADASSGVYRNVDAAGKHLVEDLLDDMIDLSPLETPLFNKMAGGANAATQTLHEWTNYSISRGQDFTITEGQDTAYASLGSPSRASNLVQEIEVPWKVSQKQQSSTIVGHSTEEAFREAEAMKIWMTSAENALLNSTLASGNASTPTRMKGLIASITTNVTNASATTLTETRFNDYIEMAWNTASDDPYLVATTMKGKRAISGFTAGVTKFTDMDDNRLSRVIDNYESDVAGNVQFIAHRDMPADTIVGIQPRAFGIAFLDRPEKQDRPALGAYKNGVVYGSLTLEYKQEKAAFKVTNIALASSIV